MNHGISRLFPIVVLALAACSTSPSPTDKTSSADSYACGGGGLWDASKCTADWCESQCAGYLNDCYRRGWTPNGPNPSYNPDTGACFCLGSCDPPPPPCQPSCPFNCGEPNGCNSLCPWIDSCSSCGVNSRCGGYYCGDCPPPPDPCNGDGCDISCCNVDNSNTYWCCGG
jgi:hypothetical protein